MSMFVSVLQQQPAFSKSKHSVSYTRVLKKMGPMRKTNKPMIRYTAKQHSWVEVLHPCKETMKLDEFWVQTFFSCLTLAILCLAPSEAIFALQSYTPGSLTTHRSHELASQAKGVKALWFEHSCKVIATNVIQHIHFHNINRLPVMV